MLTQLLNQDVALYTSRSTSAVAAATLPLRFASVCSASYLRNIARQETCEPNLPKWINGLTCVIKTDNWGEKAKRRKTVGTGRMRYMKDVSRRFKNGFQIGQPKGARGPGTKKTESS
jgi:hypothetical protein